MSADAKDLIPDGSQLLRDITDLIKESKQRVVQQLNAQLTELYFDRSHAPRGNALCNALRYVTQSVAG